MSSYPFVTGDAFRAAADLVADETGVHGGFSDNGVAFTTPERYEDLLTLSEVEGNRLIGSTMTAIVHNGDMQLSAEGMRELLSRFRRVLSVNVPPELESERLKAIPIGIENAHWATHGVARYFDEPWQKQRQTPASERGIQLLASFRVETNPRERTSLRELAQARHGSWSEPSLAPHEYLQLVRNSMFVVSPPGNGPDCHRTWEALYLGAIPVLIKGTLPAALTDDLPLLVVDTWEDLFEMNDSNLRLLARTLEQRPTRKAYLPHWLTYLA